MKYAFGQRKPLGVMRRVMYSCNSGRFGCGTCTFPIGYQPHTNNYTDKLVCDAGARVQGRVRCGGAAQAGGTCSPATAIKNTLERHIVSLGYPLAVCSDAPTSPKTSRSSPSRTFVETLWGSAAILCDP
eukprot:4519259-Pyramimonas_sp.AAC.2